ncbi:MAG: cobalamin biosynthesis protein CobW [Flavobacteriales bacterium]|nr:cobalamin biosynthesis protein CobW [Flavobacteriales bacterium]
MSVEKIPVVILNGFLGSGKTTLFRSLLKQSREKKLSICAIVNDMSELDIDGELIASTSAVEDDSKILESISSFVLSSKLGIEKLDQSIIKLLSNNSPDMIIIETSGSCHPMPLVKYFKNHEKIKLTGVFVLVDSVMIAHDFDYGKKLIPTMQQNIINGKRDTVNLLIEQILFCSHLILTKVDKMQNDQLQEIATQIKQINPYASTHSVVFGKLLIDSLFEINEYNYFNVANLFEELQPTLKSEENTERPYNLATKVIKDDRPFHPQRLWDVCHKYLDTRIYRSKGFFWLASRNSQSLLWNQAAGGINLALMGTWRAAIVEDKNNGLLKEELKLLKENLKNEAGRFGDRRCDLTIIGHKDHVAQFSEKLKSCFLNDEELKKWKRGMNFKDPWPKNIVNVKNK